MADKPTPGRRGLQFRLSTWFVLMAILAWAFAISPPQIVVTEAMQLANGKQSISTMKYLNPHYFAPVFALVAFACWKAAFNQHGVGKPAPRRRAKRIALGMALVAIAVAIGALFARDYYGFAVNIPESPRPQLVAHMLAANWSLTFYCSAGIAIGSVVGLLHSMSDGVEPNAACRRNSVPPRTQL